MEMRNLPFPKSPFACDLKRKNPAYALVLYTNKHGEPTLPSRNCCPSTTANKNQKDNTTKQGPLRLNAQPVHYNLRALLKGHQA